MIKSVIKTKEIKLSYDSPKDKYYLDYLLNEQLKTETFYGEYALEEYLSNVLNFNTEDINQLYSEMNLILYR